MVEPAAISDLYSGPVFNIKAMTLFWKILEHQNLDVISDLSVTAKGWVAMVPSHHFY